MSRRASTLTAVDTIGFSRFLSNSPLIPKGAELDTDVARLRRWLTVALFICFVGPHTAYALPSKTSVEAEIDKLASEISRLDEGYNLSRIELSETESQVRDAESRKAKADQTLGALKRQASARGIAIYRAGLPKVFMILLSSKSTDDFRRRVSILTLVADWEVEMVDEVQVAQARADEVKAQLEAKLAHKREVSKSIAARRRSIEAKVAQQKTLLSRIEAALRPARPAPRPPINIDFASLPTSPNARIAVQTAYNQIGKPYRYGAAGPNAFDCSGLTMYSWGKAGVSLPHSSRAQYAATKRVAREDLQPGDLVFFGRPIHHVGIYVGNGNMINSPETGETVDVRPAFRRDYAGAGRPGV